MGISSGSRGDFEGGGECGFFFFCKMGVGVVEKGAGSVGPAWQWQREGLLRLGDGLLMDHGLLFRFPFRKGKLFTGPYEMELDWV